MYLTVIVCTHNRSRALTRVLEDLSAQIPPDPPLDWEVLVVDNNSSDGTREIVADFVERNRPRFRYLFEATPGKVNALNAGIEQSESNIVAFTDDDVHVDHEWVRAICNAVEHFPHKLFGGRVLPLWPDHVPNWIARTGPFARPVVGGPIVSHDRGNEIREYEKGMWAPIGCNMFVRRSLFSEIGRFRGKNCPSGEVHFWTNEDCEFGFRLMNTGQKILYYPDALVHHPVCRSKFSRSYLLKYAEDAGRQTAAIELNGGGLSASQRLKTILKTLMGLSQRGLQALRMRNHPSARMHHHFYLRLHWARLLRYVRLR